MKKIAFLIISIFIIASVHAEIIQHSLSACLDSPAIALKSSYPNADYYIWTDSVSTDSIYLFYPTAKGQYSLSVRSYKTIINLGNNLMANGSFEDGYTGFYSDYIPISLKGTPVLDPTDVYSGIYDNGDHYGEYYAIMSNANRFWPGDGIRNGYANISAHSGMYFLVADATNVGYAWKTSTTDNPNLKLIKDQQYIFSYWAAYPNLPDQYHDPSAKLQFAIEYKDENGTMQTALLNSFDLEDVKPNHDWHQQITIWTAPCNSDSVSIGVKDLTLSAEGNDFCLDDIAFQSFDSVPVEILTVDSFIIDVEDCCVPISANDGKLRVDDIGVAFITYQWYCNGFAIAEATSSEHTIPLKNQNDLYYCIMTDAESNIYTSCKASYTQLTPIQEIHFNRHPAARRMRYQFGQLQVEEITYDDGSVEYRKIIQK